MAVLVGKAAPEFTEDVAIGQTTKKISLSDYKGKNYVVLFFYPLDFTFVCPTELHAFQEALKEFESRGAVVIRMWEVMRSLNSSTRARKPRGPVFVVCFGVMGLGNLAMQ